MGKVKQNHQRATKANERPEKINEEQLVIAFHW